MQRFYWVIEAALAGCSRPGGTDRHEQARSNPGDHASQAGGSEALEEDLAWLTSQGIGAVLSLTEHPLDAQALSRHGLECLHLPVDDLQAPTPKQFMQALEFIDAQRGRGRRVAVHCLMGQGRSGTILAAYLIRAAASPEEAITRLRQLCPGAIGSPAQEHALRAFAQRRDWIA
jgi:atypical dual specificity phosphatase